MPGVLVVLDVTLLVVMHGMFILALTVIYFLYDRYKTCAYSDRSLNKHCVVVCYGSVALLPGVRE